MSENEFESRVARALRVTPRDGAGARRVIMDRIRASGDRPMGHGGARGRSIRHGLAGLALAAGIGSVTTIATLPPQQTAYTEQGAVTSTVLGDSVVDRVRDTLRLVRLIFADTAARHVAIVGDFNNWNQTSTAMQRSGSKGFWSVTLALHDGEHRYAILVDNTRWSRNLPTRSLTVARAAN